MPTLCEALDAFLEAAAHERRDAVLRPIIVTGERRLARAFRKQGRVFLRDFAVLTPQFAPTEARTLQEDAIRRWEDEFARAEAATLSLFAEPLTAMAQAALDAGVRTAVADLAVTLTFDLAADPAAIAYLADHGAELVRELNVTTKRDIGRIVTQAMDEGWSYDKTAKAIREKYRQYAVGRPQKHIRSRAHMIAVTESGNAYEHANLMVGERLARAGLPMEKSWLTVKDARVDPHCRANEAQGWIPLGDTFSSGHARPLAHPACRCALLQRVAPDRE